MSSLRASSPAPSSPSPLIRLSSLHKSYGSGTEAVSVLRGVDLAVASGELVVILGPSGSGKTTILNLIGGVDSPTSGEVLVDGRSLGGLSDRELTAYRRSAVGYIFQFYNLIPTLTALENVALGLELQGKPGEEGEAAGRRLLNRVGLGDKADRFPAQLSGGEQQRVAIARALAKTPRIVVADEPTGNLDAANSAAIRQLLGQLNRELSTTILVATHDDQYKNVAGRVLYLEDGRLHEVSAPAGAAAVTLGEEGEAAMGAGGPGGSQGGGEA